MQGCLIGGTGEGVESENMMKIQYEMVHVFGAIRVSQIIATV